MADALKNPKFDKENIKKEINNVNSEISFRIKYNKSLSDYKIIKILKNKDSKIFSDGLANINEKDINYDEL